MAVPAFVLKKLGLIEESALKPLSIILLYVLQPFLVINAFASSSVEPSGQVALNLLIMFALGLAAHLIPFAVLKITAYATKKTTEQQKCLRKGALMMSAVFGNAGFLGVNFIKILVGDNSPAVLYAAAFICAFNIMLWTLGIFNITNDIKRVDFKKAFFAPAIIAVFIAIPLFFIPAINLVQIEPMIGKGVKFLADASLPVSMFVVGLRLGRIGLKELFSDAGVWICCAIRLVAVPLVMFLLMLPLVLTGALERIDPNNYIVLVLVIFAAMPVAASVVAFAERFDGDQATAAKAFLLSTVLSILTVPAMMMLLVWVL